MSTSDEIVFVNPFWRIIRAFSILFLAFLAVGVSAAMTLSQVGGVFGKPMSDLQAGWAATMTLSLVVSFTMLICVASFLLPARKAERIFAEFREGRCLAQWTYTPEFLARLPRRLATIDTKAPRWVRIVLGLLIGALAVLLLGLLCF